VCDWLGLEERGHGKGGGKGEISACRWPEIPCAPGKDGERIVWHLIVKNLVEVVRKTTF